MTTGTTQAEVLAVSASDYIMEHLPPFSVVPAEAALVIIDLQYASASWERGLGARCKENGQEAAVQWRLDRVDQTVIPNVVLLTQWCRAHHVPVMYITTGSVSGDFTDMAWNVQGMARSVGNAVGTEVHEIRAEVRPQPGDIVLNKTTTSAFSSCGIDSVLRAKGAKYVLCAGVSTNMCVDGTARDAAERGFRPVIVEDACSAAREEYHKSALITIQRLGGRVLKTAEMIDELRSASDTPEHAAARNA